MKGMKKMRMKMKKMKYYLLKEEKKYLLLKEYNEQEILDQMNQCQVPLFLAIHSTKWLEFEYQDLETGVLGPSD